MEIDRRKGVGKEREVEEEGEIITTSHTETKVVKGGAVFNQWSEAAAKRQQPGSQGGRELLLLLLLFLLLLLLSNE